jgi:hypothetical protein
MFVSPKGLSADLFGSWPPVVDGSLAAKLLEKNGMDRI